MVAPSASLPDESGSAAHPCGPTAGPCGKGEKTHGQEDGRVLIAGGVGAAGSLARAELYAPGAGTWTQAGSLAVARSLHTATRLPDGRVLAAGGFGTNAQPLNGAEVFDPATARWNTTASLNTARGSHTATLLPTGKVLAAGGGLSGLASAELFGSP